MNKVTVAQLIACISIKRVLGMIASKLKQPTAYLEIKSEEVRLSPSEQLSPEARQALDSYLLKLCNQLHQALMELRDNLVHETETQVLRELQDQGLEQIQQVLARLGEPQLCASQLIEQITNLTPKS
jgi:hypothetical protein